MKRVFWGVLLYLQLTAAGQQEVNTATAVGDSLNTGNPVHGTVDHHSYVSKVAMSLPGGVEDYYVYVPPGYDARSSTEYPVLYLLHGFGDHASAWVVRGGVKSYLDDAISTGKVQPMVVVMPASYGDYKFLLGGWVMWADGKKITENVDLFSQMLLTEIMPRVESDYRVSRQRRDRAIAGLSMGGREAVSIGLSYPQTFAWVGGFSAAFPTVERERLGNISPNIKSLRLLWIGCGVSDRLVFKGNMRLIAQLNGLGLQVTTIPTSGIHAWPVWRDDFERFAPLLFKTN